MDQKYGEFVGVDELYIAAITADTPTAYTTGAPQYFAPVGEIAGSPKVAKKVTYYENKPANTFTTEAETEIKVVVSGVPAQMAAYVLGKQYDAATGRVYDDGAANPPDLALGFRYDKGTSGARYYWYLKGTFSGGTEEAKSKESDVDPKTYELTYTAIVTTHKWTINSVLKSLKRVFGETTDPAFSATGWFSAVQTPDSVGAPSAIALSTIVPAAAATGVSRTSTIVITFNNKIFNDEITVVTAAGALIACAKAWDAAGKVLTMTPSAQMAATTLHIVNVAGVVDVYGQELAAVTKTFTTGS